MERIQASVEEQEALEVEREQEGIRKVIRELNNAKVKGRFNETVFGALLIKLGFVPYVDKLTEYLNIELKTHNKKERSLLLLLTEDVDEIAYVVLLSCINSAATNKSLSFTATDIITKLKDIFLLNSLKENNPKLHTYLGYAYRRANRRQKRSLIEKHIKKLYTLGEAEDDKASMLRLGTTLINLLELSGANVIQISRTPRKKVGGSINYINTISLTDNAMSILKEIDLESLALLSISKYPMVVPPKDWSTPFNGGWLRGKNFLFTVKSSDVRKHLKKNKYLSIYPIINKLQHTAWRVNDRMLDVLTYLFYNNVADPTAPRTAPYTVGGLPPVNTYSADDFIKLEDYETWHDFNREREEINIRAAGMQSKRLATIITFSIAERMKEYASIYFPYIMDYRGRVYADVAYLNPQGESYVKSLLEFSEGKYLDDTGVFWLKVHTANVYGLDKEPYENRVAWVDNNIDLIKRVGDAPLDNISDWGWCDSPYEFIAACMAYNDYLLGRKVRLAIQLDATCSGIQMYSGLLRDKVGAEAVNVIGDKRNDIYQAVADRVNTHLANGNYSRFIEYVDREGVTNLVGTKAVADSMVGKINRSIVKRNVMTVPYSVTMRGMSNQLWDIIDEASLKQKEFWVGDKWVVNKILTQLNHTSIYEIIDGARKGQEYLVELSKTLGDAAEWSSVLYNFPVRQTSLSMKELRVKTPYGSLSINVETPTLNKRKQTNSIAPNFIHNIDSTVLLYCIDNMEEQIGVIHDCFLVHPNEGNKIQEVYRKGFVEVMEADPLRNIQQQLDPEGIVPFPEYGELNLEDVYNSKYIIS